MYVIAGAGSAGCVLANRLTEDPEISVLSSVNPLTEAFIEAGLELGRSRNDDYNGASQEGFGFLQSTVRQGRRSSTAVGYLHPAGRA